MKYLDYLQKILSLILVWVMGFIIVFSIVIGLGPLDGEYTELLINISISSVALLMLAYTLHWFKMFRKK